MTLAEVRRKHPGWKVWIIGGDGTGKYFKAQHRAPFIDVGLIRQPKAVGVLDAMLTAAEKGMGGEGGD